MRVICSAAEQLSVSHNGLCPFESGLYFNHHFIGGHGKDS